MFVLRVQVCACCSRHKRCRTIDIAVANSHFLIVWINIRCVKIIFCKMLLHRIGDCTSFTSLKIFTQYTTLESLKNQI